MLKKLLSHNKLLISSYSLLLNIFVNKIATNNPDIPDTIAYALKGIILKPSVATNADVTITAKLINFLWVLVSAFPPCSLLLLLANFVLIKDF